MAKRKRPEEPEEIGETDASGGSLPPNPELEEALREAAESVSRPAEAPAEAPGEAPGEAADEAPEGSGDGEGGADELAETKDRLLRMQADFENFRRRALQERRDIYQYGHENLVKDLLSTVDNLDRAIGHARESTDGDLESLLQGVEIVHQELLSILAKHLVREIEALGKPFDPNVHEAMAQAPDGSVEPNTVVQVLQKGYQLRDRLLRPSRVIVAKEPEAAGEEDAGDAG
ncbi:MAG: nucleotide exchange factor GrpE [Myxococcota bacterium]